MGRPEHETANIDLIIEKIKSEGIDSAEKEAEGIRASALREADQILSDARKEALKIVSEAEKEILKKEKSGRKALEFAARDSILSIKTYIEGILNNLLKEKCSQALSGEGLERIIIELISSMPGKEGIQIRISEDNYKKLSNAFLLALNEKLQKGIEIKPLPGIGAGFRIYRQEDRFYQDFSDESIAEIMGVFLEPEIRLILNSSKKD